ncbi:alpha-N-arabinofuranosidase precursor [Penicillium waksmanii]|uniref:alpha-N-arabinofuranosidase precursor n=1 Tax=Penicillium waksmanii TaxID=69791 RepID=UPI0025478E80|nr:alpha-N-arabinofuranosidase precursor [Penicillium waksmanii]KAJ5988348.1 alpha-N-arabinofuranosidase precursor [Penicillium waksmanii]
MPTSPSFGLAIGLAAMGSLVAAGPCDIYGDGDTPCVAAHSSTRALYDAYSGPLYQVSRASDSKTADISPVSAGSVANSAVQDRFCARTNCSVTIIYDQSGNANHLTQAPAGGAAPGPDNLASATGAPVTLNGKKAYGIKIQPGMGYRCNTAVKTATGDGAQGMYAVLDGTDYNGECCFDYGNAETNSNDNGNAHMEAIYFGLGTGYGTGTGSGPWIMADIENGISAGDQFDVTSTNPSITSRFVTAVVKGEPNHWSIRGGDATTGSLGTYWSGVYPDGYSPMKKEGAIILGIGGDNSNWAQGTFYEGVMTSGYPSDVTENSVQANIVAAKYATS